MNFYLNSFQLIETGAFLMDLSRAFDCIPHDLLIAKMHANRFDQKILTFLYSYLKRQKHAMIENISREFQYLCSGIPQGSILGPLLFNIFINDLSFFLKAGELHSFADDNTVSAVAENTNNLIDILQSEEDTVNWFKTNNMILNPEKFQAIILNKNKINETHATDINVSQSYLHPAVKLQVS